MGVKYAMIGAGGWGTAVGCVLAENGIDVWMWGHDGANARRMQKARTNRKYLSGHRFPDNLTVTDDAAAAMDGADVIMTAVPTKHTREVWRRIAGDAPRHVPVVSLTKGIENRTMLRPTQIVQEVAPGRRVAVLSGPSHAEEVVKGVPTTVTVASRSADLAKRVQGDLVNKGFRVYTNRDILGVELGGAMKNVIALAAGIVDGLGFGDNTKAALLTRGLHEITRLGCAMGARQKTFYGMAGMGDMITTAFSPFGRNRAVGEKLGRGISLDEILASTAMVAEGVWTTKSVMTLSRKLKVEMPISREVYRALFQGKSPRKAVEDLMTRRQRGE